MQTYLDSNVFKRTAYARRIGISAGTFSDIMNNKNLPSLETAVKIERDTGGAVRCLDWCPEIVPVPEE